MKSVTKQVTLALLAGILVIISLYFIVRFSIDSKNRDTTAALETILHDQEKLLISLAEATRINGADKTTERVVIDCNSSDRQRFDNLLDLLSSTISVGELKELNSLFNKCGSFYSNRKSVMAAKLVREVQVFSDYLNLQSVLKDSRIEKSAKIVAWQNLAEAELKTAEYFNKLVVLQATIIETLTAGKSNSSPEITEALNEVVAIRGQMAVLSNQIEVQKSEALKL